MPVNFGYHINSDRQIDLDQNDRSLYSKVAHLEPSLRVCISCGTCSSACTAANFTEFSLRKVILHLQRGLISQLRSEVSKCMLCGKCQLACPRGVNTRNLILSLQKVLENG